MSSRLSVTLLGPFQAFRDGRPLRGFRYEKVRALFAYLIVEHTLVHSRRALAALLWPDQSEGVARSNLRQALATLRRVLEEGGACAAPLLKSDRETVRLVAEEFDVDLHRFLMLLERADALAGDHRLSALEEAVTLYSHGFLHGLVLVDAPPFEEWVRSRRAALHQRFVAALERLVDELETMGDLRRALLYNQQLLAAEPWQEAFQRRQMRLLGLTGQSSAALNHYEAFRRRLEEEIGVAPEPETAALVEAVRRRGLEGAAEAGVHSEPQERTLAERERRRLTVLNCALATPLDLDDLLEVAGAFRSLCREIAVRHGGSLRMVGSEAIFYFGYPAALEDAASRAVQAGLEVIDGVGRLAQGRASLSCQGGVYTGMVVAIGGGDGLEVIGAAPQLASQLRQAAPAGSLLIGAPTHRLVERQFLCEALGRRFAPLQRELTVFRVIGTSGICCRLCAAMAEGLTPFTGREPELQALLATAERVEAGRGGGVLLKGEAGIGKSRLGLILKERLTASGWLLRECRCSPQHQRSPFHIAVDLIEQLCGIAERDSPRVRLEKAEAQFSSYSVPLSQTMPVVAELLALDVQGRYPPPPLPPEQRRRQTIELLCALVLDRARRRPVLLLVEDLHWVDPSSLEVIDLLLDRAGEARLFMLLTARPEFSQCWEGVKELNLAPLAPAQAEALVRHVVGDAAVSAELIAAIIRQSDGVPLFLEEMAKTVVENLARSGAQDSEVPASLYDLLMARIDRLGTAKPTLQLAATLGREFSEEMIAAVSDSDAGELMADLRRIVDSGLLLEQENRGGKVYLFKHALIQEAAYGSQLHKERQRSHRRIAEMLIGRKPTLALSRPELIAQHLLAGGESERAVDYWLQAGQLQIERSANAEAMAQLQTALALLAQRPDSEARRRKELEVQIALGVVLLTLRGYGSQELKSAYARAMELSEALGERKLLFRSLWGLWLSASSRSGYREALELARELLRVAEQESDPALLIYAHNTLAGSNLWLGELTTSLEHALQVERMYRPAEHDPLVFSFGDGVAVTTLSYRSWLAWLMGQPDLALRKSSEALAAAERIDHPHSRGFALTFAAMLHFFRGEPERTLDCAEEILRLNQEQPLPLWAAAASMFRGWVQVVNGDMSALEEISPVLESMRDAMVGVEVSFLVPIACAFHSAGRLAVALTVLEKALAVAERIDDRYLEAELHRLRGECLLGLAADESAARGCFEQALGISRRQGARMLELRAALSLGRLLDRQGFGADAVELLQPLYARFEEGFDTPDLRAAAEFLRERLPAGIAVGRAQGVMRKA